MAGRPAADRSARFTPTFRLLFAAQTVSLFGSLVSRTALPFVAILFLEARPMAVAMLSVADVMAGLASVLVLGTLVDRWPKRRTLLVADTLRALLLAAVPLGAWGGWLTMPVLFGIALACGVLNVAFDLAYAAWLPRLVAPPDLLAANSRVAAGQAIVEVGSFGIGGWLVQWLGAPLAVLVDALSFVASALLVWRTPRAADRRESAPAASAAPAGFLHEAREGLGVLWHDPILRALALVEFFVAGGFSMFGAIFMLFLTRELGFAPGVLGLIFAVGGVSSLLGAMLAERLAARVPAGPLMIAGLVLTAASMFLPPLAGSVGIAAGLLLLAQQLLGDGAATLYQINDTLLRQTRAPAQALARVNAGIKAIGFAAMLPGALLAGWVAEAASARRALWWAAACVSLGAGVALLSKLRRLGRQP